MNTVIKSLKLFLATIVVFLTLLLVALMIGIRVDLSPWQKTLEQAISEHTPYHLSAAGKLEATLSFWPAVTLSDIRLSPADDPDTEMVTIDYINAQVGILPLLRNTIDIDHIIMDTVTVQLHRDKYGKANWDTAETLATTNKSTSKPATANDTQQDSSVFGYTLNIEQKIAIQNFSITYQDKAEGTRVDAAMDVLEATLEDDQQLHVSANGTFADLPWHLKVTTELQALLDGKEGSIDLQAALADADVRLEGSVNPDTSKLSSFNLKVNFPSAETIESFVDPELAHIAPASLTGSIRASSEQLDLNKVIIQLANSDIQGDLSLRNDTPPVVHGDVLVRQLDLEPWLAQTQSEADPEPEETEAATSQQTDNQPFGQLVSDWLNSADIDVNLSLVDVLGLPASVQDATLAIKMSDGELTAPMGVNLEGVALTGQLNASAKGRRLSADASLASQQADIGPLTTILLDSEATGQVEQFSLSISSQGKKVSRLIRNAHLGIELLNVDLNFTEGGSWKVHDASGELGLAIDTRFQLDAELMQVPMQMTVNADPLTALRRGIPWHLDIKADSPAFTASAKGFISEQGLDESGQFSIYMNVDELGALSQWLGVKDDIKQPLRFSGNLSRKGDITTVTLPKVQVGHSSGQVNLEWHSKWQNQKDKGFAKISTHLPKLDLDELSGFFPQTPNTTDQPPAVKEKNKDGLQIHAPLLARELHIADADIDFRLDNLRAAGEDLRELTFAGKIRDGWLRPSPFAVEYAGSHFYGDMALDLRQKAIAVDASLAVDQPDFGRILANLDIIHDLDLSLGQAQLSLAMKGQTMAELIQQLRLKANLEGGKLTLTDANTGATSDILLKNGSISAQPNQRLTLKLAGELKELPVKMEVSFNPLSRILANNKNLNMQFAAHIEDMSLLSYSVVSLPLDQKTIRLGVIFRTPSLTSLNSLLDVDLPPYGPIEMHGRFGITPEGYEMQQSRVVIGDSSLTGEMRLLTLDKPELNIQLQAPSIQVDDFKVGDWQAWANPESDNPKKKTSTEPDNSESETTRQPLLSARVLNQLDGQFQLDVDEVLSGSDSLGAGQLKLTLQDGAVSLNPLYIDLPGGEINISGYLKPGGDAFSMEVSTNIEHLDYGILARRVDPKTSMQGEISFNMDIQTTAKTPDDLFSHARGDLAFAVWPRDFEAGVIDLWAVGLASAVLPRIGSTPSQLNCAVGTFKLEDGQMDDNTLILDTSRMQVLGHSKINFTNQSINLVLVPRAKTAQIFGLSLPVMVTGSFTDFGFGIPSGELIITTLRFISSPLITPLRWLLEQPLEADGSARCQQVYNQSGRLSPEKLRD